MYGDLGDLVIAGGDKSESPGGMGVQCEIGRDHMEPDL